MIWIIGGSTYLIVLALVTVFLRGMSIVSMEEEGTSSKSLPMSATMEGSSMMPDQAITM